MQTSKFTNSLREWRKLRKMSQLDLALAAEVSQRHVSWLETGRSKPSREMVVRLSDAMEVPLRERNHFLSAAGFAKMYSQRSLDEPSMEPIRNILTDMLTHHEPYPAFVLDRSWNIVMQNNAADLMFNIVGEPNEVWTAIGDDGLRNIALLTVHPKGLRQFISNWDEIAAPFIQRLKKEAIDSADPEIIDRYEKLANFVDMSQYSIGESILPMLPINIDLGGPTFGTAQDITANELRVETFYPADKPTAKFFKE